MTGLLNGTWNDMAIETIFMRYETRNSQNLGIQLACMQQHRERLE